MLDDRISHKFWIEGPRWSGIPSFLRRQAWVFPDLELQLHEDRGWINTVVYATVSGPEDQLGEYLRIVDQAIAEYGNF